jgi:hypothetical protein
MPIVTDHTGSAVSITQMVYNRLPFLDAESDANHTLISVFILEVMHELNGCLDKEEVGNEEDYTEAEKSLIADVVSLYVIFLTSAQNSGTANSSSSSLSKFLSAAKAGSAEVEYEQFDIKKAHTVSMGSESLINFLKGSINRKSSKLGCPFDVCDDCTLAFGANGTLPPFIVVGDSDCGCG